MAHEVGVRAEGESPHSGVDAVRADDHVVALAPAAGEPDMDAVRGLVQLRDAIPEPVLDARPGRLEEDPGEVAAQDLELRDDALAAEHLRRHLDAAPPPRVDHREAALVEAGRPDHGAQAHPLDHLARRAPDVDRLAARPRPPCLLDDGHLRARPLQAQRQRRPGDPRSRDEHPCRTPSAYAVQSDADRRR